MALLPTGALRRSATKLGTAARNAPKTVPNELRRTRDSFEAATVDDTAPITRSMEQHRPDDAGRLQATVTTNTRSAATNKSARVFDLGILPGPHKLRVAPLNQVMRQVRSLPETDQQTLRNAFEAGNELLQMRRDPTMDKSNEKLLLDIVAKAENDDRLRPIMGAWENVRTGVAEYLHREGYTDAATHVDFMSKKGYVPTIYKAQESDNTGARLFNRAFVGSTSPKENLNPSMKKRRPAEDTAMMRSEREKLDVFEAMYRYVDDAVRYTGENTARREFMDAMLQGTDAFGPVRKLDKVSQSDHNVIQIKRNGQTERYSISDNKLYNALKFDNHFVIPAFNELRKFEQWTTTGTWAFPFAPTSLMYDTGFGLIGARSKNMVTGPIDSYLSLNGVSATARDLVAPITRMVDMGMVNTASGIYHGVVGRRTEEMVRQSLRYAADAGLYDPKMPAATRKQIEDGLSQAYRRYNETIYGQIAHRGHTVSTFSDDTVQAGAFERLLGVAERSKKYRQFAGFIEAVKEAQRLALFGRNVAHTEKKNGRKLTDPEYDKIATEVRNVAADPTKLGSSKIVTGYLSTSAYGNVMLQSTYHILRQANNVAAWSTLFWFAAGQLALRHWIESNSVEGAYNEKVEETATYIRVTSVLVPRPMSLFKDGPWTKDDLVWMGIGPELGLVGSIGAQVINTMYDAMAELESPEGPGMLSDAGAAVANLMNFTTPTFINWGAAMSGHPKLNFADMFFKERNPQMPPMRGSNEMQPDWRGHGMSSGWVSERGAAIMHMAFGMHGATLTDALELSLDHEYNGLDNQSFFEGARKAWGVTWNNTLGRENVIAPLFPDSVVQRDSKGTPLSHRFYEIKSSLNQLVHQENIIRGGGIAGNITNPVSTFDGAMLVPHIRDDKLRDQVMQVAMHFKDKERKMHLDELGKLERKLNMYKNNLSMSRTAANAIYNDYVGAIQQRQRLLLEGYNRFEETMQRQYPDWTLEQFTKDVVSELRMGHAPRE